MDRRSAQYARRCRVVYWTDGHLILPLDTSLVGRGHLFGQTAEPTTRFATVSKITQVVVGERLNIDAFRGDLLAAGYEQVGTIEEDNQFSVQSGQFTIRTGEFKMPNAIHPPKVDTITIRNGTASSTSNTSVVLRPTVLARFGDIEKKNSSKTIYPTRPSTNSNFGDGGPSVSRTWRRRPHWNWTCALSQFDAFGDKARRLDYHPTACQNLFLSHERTLQRKIERCFSHLRSRVDCQRTRFSSYI